MEPWKSTADDTTLSTALQLQWGHGDGAVEEEQAHKQFLKDGMLQWGHGDGAVEEVLPHSIAVNDLLLQWGHGDGAVEEIRDFAPLGTRCPLQWGHGDGAVEENPYFARLNFSSAASMGPRRWSRGRDGDRGARAGQPTGFNGATAMEPWKRSTLTTSQDNGVRFNGATAMEPWKRTGSGGSATATMTLQWGHGDGAVEEGIPASVRSGGTSLQWGHGDGAVE